MNCYYIMDENGNPKAVSDIMVWGEWWRTAERHIGLDKIGEVKISTVFLGIDHGFNEPEPILYETMIFGGEHDGYQERYSTKEEAIAGHKIAVELVNKT